MWSPENSTTSSSSLSRSTPRSPTPHPSPASSSQPLQEHFRMRQVWIAHGSHILHWTGVACWTEWVLGPKMSKVQCASSTGPWSITNFSTILEGLGQEGWKGLRTYSLHVAVFFVIYAISLEVNPIAIYFGGARRWFLAPGQEIKRNLKSKPWKQSLDNRDVNVHWLSQANHYIFIAKLAQWGQMKYWDWCRADLSFGREHVFQDKMEQDLWAQGVAEKRASESSGHGQWTGGDPLFVLFDGPPVQLIFN